MENQRRTGADRTVADMRSLLADCFERRPWIYWTDLAVSVAVAYPAALYFLLAPGFGPLHVLAYFVGGFGLFRVGSFIHEIQHMRPDEMKGFKTVWNLVCGVPLLMTSNTYDNHADHHSARTYGTDQDGEYVPLGAGPPSRILRYYLQVPLLPFLALLRFGVIGPLSLLHPGLRRWVLAHASSYGINPDYVLEPARQTSQRLYALRDLVCGAYVIGLGVALATGALPLSFLGRLYVLVVFTIGLNWTRNLAAHRYVDHGGPIPMRGQLEDTITITGGPWTELLFPIGLRYHSLHHVLATIPYHQLGRAHRRLLAQLEPDAPYRRTLHSLTGAFRALLEEARRGAAGVPGARPA
ncbi:MAG: fatty acid desaturase [Myxococcales bacterium]|nr:fatty acid desaturase [Myxococcales bacterium]